jgi:hypothetical protein
MAAFHVGKTIKITGSARHTAVDALLTDNVDLTSAFIVDIGASDGSTSVDLIQKLPAFRRYVIADLYLHISADRHRGRVYFYGPDDRLILVVGKRWLAWPTLSRPIAALLRHGAARARTSGTHRDVLLLNPEAQEIISRDPRVSYRVHDVFTPWPDPKPDVIKVANLLRRLYFTDVEIAAALRALLASLPEHGHLLVADNPRIAGIDERAGLYQRQDARFVAIAHTAQVPEIDSLVIATR